MEIRWVIYENKITAADVAAYRDEARVSLDTAARVLRERTAPRLQYRQGMSYDWQDVPTVVLPHPLNPLSCI